MGAVQRSLGLCDRRIIPVALAAILLAAVPARGATPVVQDVTPPDTTAAAGGTIDVTVTGSDFEINAVVLFNGTPAIFTGFASSTMLSARLPTGDGGQFEIKVRNPLGEESLESVRFAVNTIQPTLFSVDPSTVPQGGPDFDLTARGSDFANSSELRWNGEPLGQPRVISAGEIRATVPAALIETGPSATVTVFTAGAGNGPGGESSPQPVTIVAQPPTVNALIPDSTFADGPEFQLVVVGENFNSTSKVRWNGSERPTTFDVPTQLTATIHQADIATATTATVDVVNVNTGLTSSPARTFAVNTPLRPSITSITPNSRPSRSGGFMLTVDGDHFATHSRVRWNGADRDTTFESATRLTAQILADDLQSDGTAQVTVFTLLGSLTSDPTTFTISSSAPTISSVSPDIRTAGDPEFILTVNGSNFDASSRVRWNGSERATTFDDATRLRATILPADIAVAGLVAVTVRNGSTDQVSNVSTVTVNNPVPVASSLEPPSGTVGGDAFSLTVNGSGFVNGSKVRWNGEARLTTFVNSGQLRATISAVDISHPGTAQVTVISAAPGGGTSSPPLNFAINNPAPTLTGIHPENAPAGSQDFTLQTTGSGFVDSSVVLFGRTPLTPSQVTSTVLTVTVPASLITDFGRIPVTVMTPPPGGGTSSALTFQVTDTTPPDTTIISGPSGTITTSTATFTWTGTDNTPPASLVYAFRLDPIEPAFSTFTGGTSKTYTGLANGTYTFLVKARDQAGNEGSTPASRSFTVSVDSTPPETRITGGPSGTTDGSATFFWTGTDDTTPITSLFYAFRLDPLEPTFSVFTSATSKTYTGLANGPYTFLVKARDQAGNEDPTPASRSFTVSVDSTPPDTTITTGPGGTITASSATFTWTGADNVTPPASLGYAVRLDPIEPAFSEFTSATSKTYTSLANGAYTFLVKARDQAGNEDPTPASQTFTVNADTTGPDTTPPDIHISAGPSGVIANASSVSFTWTGHDNVTPTPNLVYAFRLDPIEPTFAAFGGATTKTYDLPNGDYSFFVKARDQAGNESATAESRAFTINAPPPPLMAAVLPSSRSVQTGAAPATAFVSIINAGVSTAFAVGIGLSGQASAASSAEVAVTSASPPPVDLTFQTTDPDTNLVVGTPNSPADIPAGRSQTYVVDVRPRAAFSPTDVVFSFQGTNTPPAPTIPGVNTLTVSASPDPVPDVVALALSITNDGIVHVPGIQGSNAFAVATVNVGAWATVTAAADTGSASLPVTVLLCQTNSLAQCVSPPAPAATVTTQINTNDTPTFSVFVRATGSIPFDPAVNRIVVRFKDTSGVDRGSTSVAVTTD